MFSSQFRDLERVQSLNPCWSGFADGISAIPRPGALGPPPWVPGFFLMKCPKCGSPTRVFRTTALSAAVVRERICKECQHKFSTEEKRLH